MSDIFISYASSDRQTAERLARALTGEGWTVWWDRTIPPGKSFAKMIENALKASKCVVVLWSGASRESEWVQKEARFGNKHQRLIPILIEDVLPPFEFQHIQAAALMDWRSDAAHAGYQRLFRAISGLAGPPSKRPEEAGSKALKGGESDTTKPRSRFTRRNWILAATATAGVLAFAVALNPIHRHFLVEQYPLGETFRDCGVCPEMVVVPAGSFVMGSPPDGSGRKRDSRPQHRVNIPEPFSVGVYEVTFAEWDTCAADGGCDGYRPDDRDMGRDRRPAIHVSWFDALAYIKWLSNKTGRPYRLPTEAEWEYLARAGTSTPFTSGSTISADQANFKGLDGSEPVEQRDGSLEGTLPVGSFQANAFGVYDTHGNVWEWVADCFNPNAYKAHKSYPAMVGEWDQFCLRVVRGGGWSNGPEGLRSDNRTRLSPDARSHTLGFRVARTADR